MATKTTRKTTAPNKQATAKRKQQQSKTFKDHFQGFVSKKGLLIGASVIALLGLGAGGYALWQNNSASAAGKWTGTQYFILNSKAKGKGSVSGTTYQCKNPVRGGYQYKYKAVVSKVTGDMSGIDLSVRTNGAGNPTASAKVKKGLTITSSYSKTYAGVQQGTVSITGGVSQNLSSYNTPADIANC